MSEDNIIEIRDPEIDVKKITETIQKRIEEKKKAGIYKDDPMLSQNIALLKADILSQGLSERIKILKMLARVNLDGEQITSHRPVAGMLIKTVKKITRFWIRKYTDDIFAKQNQFNAEITFILEDMDKEISDIKKIIEEIKRREG